MKQLGTHENTHLEAARAWLQLGNAVEAHEELEQLADEDRIHPDVLLVRYQIYEHAQKWDYAWPIGKALTTLAPFRTSSWIYAANACRHCSEGGLKEAQNLLLRALELHPESPLILFKLACFASQLGHLDDAANWLARAFEKDDTGQLRLRSLDETDLEPLWANTSVSEPKPCSLFLPSGRA